MVSIDFVYKIMNTWFKQRQDTEIKTNRKKQEIIKNRKIQYTKNSTSKQKHNIQIKKDVWQVKLRPRLETDTIMLDL